MATKTATGKPNILVIWGDDIGWFNPSCYHHGIMGYRTPNIDRVAREGASPAESAPRLRSAERRPGAGGANGRAQQPA